MKIPGKAQFARAYRFMRGRFGPRRDETLQFSIGQLQSRILATQRVQNLCDAEFRVFSQWGEDGIIQFIINQIKIRSKTFVEFGVQDYSESNTRFLLMNDNWRGFIIDGDGAHQRFLRKNALEWQYDIRAVKSFITAENINQLLTHGGMEGELGILSVDIDGVDYWVLSAIDSVSPQVVIVEYNGFLGCELAVTVPYRDDFQRHLAHPSNFYWGASLPAFYSLLNEKGYAFLGCNTAGNNAFFVNRSDLAGQLKEVTLRDGFVDPKYWECRNNDGSLKKDRDRLTMFSEIRHLELVDVSSGAKRSIDSLGVSKLANHREYHQAGQA